MSILYPQFFIFFLLLLWMRQAGEKRAKILYIASSLLIIALSRPVLTESKQLSSLAGKEFIIALDVSYSMQAKDIAPSRVQRAKKIIREILKSNPDDRFSLFAFTSNPLILCPSTSDHQLLLNALDALKVENILTHSTTIQKLFDYIHTMNLSEKNLILLSDGGEERELNSYTINLITIAMASKRGATLYATNNKQLKDKNGHLIISRMNPLLKNISNRYFYHDSVDFSLDFVKQSLTKKREERNYYELFWIPLLLSLILFFLYYIKLPKRVLLLFPFLALPSQAALLDWYYIQQANSYYHDKHYKEAVDSYEKIKHKTMQSQMNIANAYYQAGAYQQAKILYKSLKTTAPKLKKRILFKLGNCAAKLEEYTKAREYYLESLAFGEDPNIRHNLKSIEGKKDNDKVAKKSGADREKVKSKNSQAASKNKNGKKSANASDASSLSHPLGYKAYELINKGYINEKKPW